MRWFLGMPSFIGPFRTYPLCTPAPISSPRQDDRFWPMINVILKASKISKMTTRS